MKKINSEIMIIIQNLLQIENKLFNFEHRCLTCIKENVLKVESSIEALMQTDNSKNKCLHPVLKDLPNALRIFQKKMLKCTSDKQYCKLSQNIRVIRKKLVTDFYNCDKTTKYIKKNVNHKCPRKILPILNPCFNIREIVKNILLLEDHLLIPERRCLQCIKKHSLIIEAFLDEAITIDKSQKYIKILKHLPKKMRKIQKNILIGRSKYYDIAMDLKKIRTPLMDIAFDFVKKC